MKLIDLLVKELPRRGGWPEAANYVVQDNDGTVKFSKSIDFLHIKAGEWCSNEDGDDWIYGDRPFEGNFIHHTIAHDRNSSIITRAQYEVALAASKAVVGHNGWIQWAGGECPVDSDAIVEVKFRRHNQRQYNNDRAGDFDWACTGRSIDIIAYRLHDQGINHRANDDRLEQDLNECIGQDFAPEWDGEGLPPAGVECEFKCSTGEWVTVEITAIARSGVCFVERGKNGENYVSFSGEFRPLRTEAEKLRESAINDIATLIGRGTFFQDAERIYDAISSGEIKVYSKENK